MQKNWWGYHKVTKLVQGEKKAEAWKLLEEMVQRVPASLLSMVGAGPLEDCMRQGVEPYIEKLERSARRSSRWRVALKNVWFRPEETTVSERLVPWAAGRFTSQ